MLSGILKMRLISQISGVATVCKVFEFHDEQSLPSKRQEAKLILTNCTVCQNVENTVEKNWEWGGVGMFCVGVTK